MQGWTLRLARRGLFIPLLLAPFLRGQEAHRFSFDHLMPGTPGGQSFPLVHCLIQDRRGFIWVTGPYDLARYDGNSFLFFPPKDGDPDSLSDNLFFSVFEDSRGDIWVTSDKGLCLLDRQSGRFRRFRNDPADPRSLSSDRTRAICEDKTGALWIGTTDGGVNRMNPGTREFTRFLHDPADANSPGSNAIWVLCRDREGKIWMGATDAGIDNYDPQKGTWTHYPYRERDPGGLGDRHYWALQEGRDGRLWIGTNEGGLYWLEPATGKFSKIRLREPEARGGDYRILALREDRDGILWIGTDNAGLYRFDKKIGALSRIRAAPNEPGGLSHDSIMSIVEDREGLLWFGTAWGISILDKKRLRFPLISADPKANGGSIGGEALSFYEDRNEVLWVGTAKGEVRRWERKADPGANIHLNARVQAITEDDKGELWFGTSSGLHRYIRRTGALTRYRSSRLDFSVLPNNNITVLLRGRPGFLWVGTKGGGFFEWDVAGEKVRLLPGPTASRLSNDQVNAMLIDRRGMIWIATQWRGLFRFEPETGRWSEFGHRPNDPRSLASPTVYAIAEDEDGKIWVGTQAGPCLFDAEKEGWIRLADVFGLADRPVYGLVPVGDGSVWMSSESEVVEVRLDSGRARIFGPEDGLQGGRFGVGACLRRRSGEIVFGGAAGFDRFFPSAIAVSPCLSPIAVSAIALSSPAGLIPLFGAPDAVDIPRSRFPVTVLLSAPSYSHPERNRYRVREATAESRVFELGTNRGLRLETLERGPHRFLFYAANPDGVWNPEGVALTIRVTVPFWQSWFWKAALAVLVAVSLRLWLQRRRRLMDRTLLHRIGEDLNPLAGHFDLTKREQEILGLILQGKSNKEIESGLFISDKTVKSHIYNLYRKLDVKSRLDLVNAVREFASRKSRP